MNGMITISYDLVNYSLMILLITCTRVLSYDLVNCSLKYGSKERVYKFPRGAYTILFILFIVMHNDEIIC